jgi:hypothetical protein
MLEVKVQNLLKALEEKKDQLKREKTNPDVL